MANSYGIGDRVKISATFRNSLGVLSNTTVVLRLRTPAGVSSTPTPTNSSTGVYDYEILLTGSNAQAGRWQYRFEGTGSVDSAEDGDFYVGAALLS